MSLAVLVCPTVGELSQVRTNIRCPVQGCQSVFNNSSNLEMHLIKTHDKCSSYLDKKREDVVFQYFCPVEGCKYQLNADRSLQHLRWFTKMKFLKQHYLKVHKVKEFDCDTCSKKFLTLKDKNIHKESECGRKFVCHVCSFTYQTKLSLLNHAKRKNHLLQSDRPEKVNKVTSFNQILNRERVILPNITLDSSVNIAAAALSELSRKIVVKGVDKGIQTVNRRRSCARTVRKNASLQTQCRISAETQTTSIYSNKKQKKSIDSAKCIETQTIQDTDNAVDSEDSIFSNLNPSKSSNFGMGNLQNFWTRNESATQTHALRNTSTDDLSLNLLDNFESSKLSSNSNVYMEQFDRLIQQSTILDDTRLCNIETQTELDSFIEDAPIFSNNETQTIRHSLDDIYSHNCTQTCEGFFADFVEFADIETQTGWASHISADFVSAETQTIF